MVFKVFEAVCALPRALRNHSSSPRKSMAQAELPEKKSAMSSLVEVKGRPRSSTTPSFMACDSSRRFRSRPSTSLSCTSNTARKGHRAFPHVPLEAAFSTRSPKAAFPSCKAPSWFLPQPLPCGPAPLPSLASLGHFGPVVPDLLLSSSPAPLSRELWFPGEFH